MPESEKLLRVSRPAIEITGTDEPELASGLLRLSITESTTGLYRCEATFGNWGPRNNSTGFLYFDREKLEFGREIKIKLGNDSIFAGRIMAIEASFPEGAPPEICLLAEDRFQDLRMTRRTRTFTDISDSDVMSQIANDHGLSPSIDFTSPTHKVLAQVNQSDLAFVRERARANNAELWMEGSTLKAKTRGARGGSPLEVAHGKDLREFTVLADLAEQRSKVSISGWDVAGKSAIKHQASDSVMQSELNGDAGGASVLSSALSERIESVAHAVPFTSDEAKAVAESYYRSMARRFVVGRGVAETRADLRVGTYLKITNIGPLFSGKYYVSEVCHRFDGKKGIRTEFTAERPGLGRAE